MTLINGYTPLIQYNLSELRPLIYQYGTDVTYTNNSVVLSPNQCIEGCYFIDKGRARYVIMSPQGEEHILGILEQDSFFCVVPIFLSLPTCSLFVITEVPTVLYKLNTDTFMKLLDASPTFRKSTLKGLASHVSMLMCQIQSLLFNSCKDRLYELLRASSDIKHPVDAHWYKLKYQYTQEDMGKIIGASRITVTRLINELCNEGLIRILNRKIEVHAVPCTAKKSRSR